MIARSIRNLENLLGFHAEQINAGDARCVVAIDEQPTAIVFAGCLRQRRVMRVIPRHETEARVQHGFSFFAVTVSVLRILREHRDRLESSA